MNTWLEVPKAWVGSLGEIFGFGVRVAGLVYNGRVLQFTGEALRKAGILILGSTLMIWGRSSSSACVRNRGCAYLVHIVGMLGTRAFWGANPRAPIGG